MSTRTLTFSFFVVLSNACFAGDTSSLTGQALFASKEKEISCFTSSMGKQVCMKHNWSATACDNKLLPILKEHGFTREHHYRSHGVKSVVNDNVVNVVQKYSDGERTIRLSSRLVLNEEIVKNNIASYQSEKGKLMAQRHVDETVKKLAAGQVIDAKVAIKEARAIVEEQNKLERAQLLEFFEKSKCETSYEITVEGEALGEDNTNNISR